MTDWHTPRTVEDLAARGAHWRKSSYSDGAGNNCVEVAHFPAEIGIRDSKNKTGPALVVNAATWSSFVRFACQGR
ncbi:DUF397 domain-containing protein [Streptomyces sp. NPDC048290]|uniref:DUF397 domain-containing protein n=1 Tax=Streptomyces sp. NPDC048290 TaxID=3155811 RepID=UPI00342E199F